MMRKSLCLAVVLAAGSAAATTQWEYGPYSPDEYVESIDRVNKSRTGVYADGNLSTKGTPSNWSTVTFNFDSPKDVTGIRVLSCSADGTSSYYDITAVSVKYEGADSSVQVVSGKSFSNLGTNTVKTVITDDSGFLAKRVMSISVRFMNGSTPIAEIEILGRDSVEENIRADYVEVGGALTAALSATVAPESPAEVFFCSGATDGGDDRAAWDNCVQVAELSAAQPTTVYNDVVDFRFCRFCLVSGTYSGRESWSDVLEVGDKPAGRVEILGTTTSSVKLEADLHSPGEGCASADLYFAIAKEGEDLPDVVLLKIGVAPGESVEKEVDGLVSTTNYTYRFEFRNALGKIRVLEGVVRTKDDCYWVMGEYKPSEWVSPADRVYTHCSSTALFDDKLSTYNTYMSSNSTVECTWNDPFDIDYVEAFWSGTDRGEILRVEIRYEGDDAYHPLSGTYINHNGSVVDRRMATLRGTDGPLGSRVTGLKFVAGYWNSNWANGFAEIFVHGKYSDSDLVWDVSRIAAADYVPADDYLDGYKEGYAVVHDKDIATGQERVSSGETYVWNFDKPKDLRQMRFYLDSATIGFGRVQIKRKGDADYTSIPGTALSIVEYSGSGPLCAILRKPTGKKGFIVRNVVSVKIAVNSTLYINTPLEVEVDGREAAPGLKLIIR